MDDWLGREKGRRGLFLRLLRPFLMPCGRMVGVMGLMGLIGGCGGGAVGVRWRERHRGARERLWELDIRLDIRLDIQLGIQLDIHFPAFRRTQKAAFLTKRGCSLAVLRQKGVGVWEIEN